MKEGMLLKDSRYKVFEIREEQVREAMVDGSLPAVAGFIQGCGEGSIVIFETMDGEPFMILLSRMFLFCSDRQFLDGQLLPHLKGQAGGDGI